MAVEVTEDARGARSVVALAPPAPGNPPLTASGWSYIERYAAPCPPEMRTARVLESIQRAAEMRGRPTRG